MFKLVHSALIIHIKLTPVRLCSCVKILREIEKRRRIGCACCALFVAAYVMPAAALASESIERDDDDRRLDTFCTLYVDNIDR
jgi:hypothetical protein